MNLAEMLSMADKASEGVDVNQTATSFEPVKPGNYNVVVTQCNGPVQAKRANPCNPSEFGQFLDIRLSIVDGEFAGRLLFIRNNILVYPKTMSNDDQRKAQMAMAIGANERKVMLASIGKNAISTAEELVGATFSVNVVVTNDMNGKPRNEVKKIMPSGSVPAAQVNRTPVQQAAPAQSAQPSRPKMPWEK